MKKAENKKKSLFSCDFWKAVRPPSLYSWVLYLISTIVIDDQSINALKNVENLLTKEALLMLSHIKRLGIALNRKPNNLRNIMELQGLAYTIVKKKTKFSPVLNREIPYGGLNSLQK